MPNDSRTPVREDASRATAQEQLTVEERRALLAGASALAYDAEYLEEDESKADVKLTAANTLRALAEQTQDHWRRIALASTRDDAWTAACAIAGQLDSERRVAAANAEALGSRLSAQAGVIAGLTKLLTAVAETTMALAYDDAHPEEDGLRYRQSLEEDAEEATGAVIGWWEARRDATRAALAGSPRPHD